MVIIFSCIRKIFIYFFVQGKINLINTKKGIPYAMDHRKKSTTNLPFKSLGCLFDLINSFSSS
jgi:hypothetical protein